MKGFEKDYTPKIAEIGVYKGRMTAMVCGMFSDAGLKVDYYCIDHFQGSAEHEKKNYYPEFCDNVDSDKRTKGVTITPFVVDSVKGSKMFKDEHFDMVYLDASHDYLSVKADIQAWLPKVKKGGVLCGDDYIRGWDGVIQAVDEAFGDKVERVAGEQWYVVKKIMEYGKTKITNRNRNLL